MAARCSKSELRGFYENLIARGKKKMVALTALMRKIVVIDLDYEIFIMKNV